MGLCFFFLVDMFTVLQKRDFNMKYIPIFLLLDYENESHISRLKSEMSLTNMTKCKAVTLFYPFLSLFFLYSQSNNNNKENI